MPQRVESPVTPESIAAAKLARDAERAAAGIVCDADDRIIYELTLKRRTA